MAIVPSAADVASPDFIASSPIATTYPTLVDVSRALLPIATLLCPSVRAFEESLPIEVFELPPARANPE